MNAAVDKTLVVGRLRLRRLNRPERVVTLPGGKGINVARALTRLGEPARVLGFTAGTTGDFIERSLAAEGVRASWARLASGQSRTCLAILDGGGAPTEVNEEGAPVPGADRRRLQSLYAGLLRRAEAVVLSGSLPPGCPDPAYARLIRAARRLGKPAWLDTSGRALKPALAARPDLVKLNREEAASLGLPAGDPRRLARALARLCARGPREAAATLGAEGAVAFLAGGLWRAVAPRVRAVTPVGCGDTFLAGLLRARLHGEPPPRALAYATALATASALVPGAGVFKLRDVPGILSRVRVERLA